MAARYAVNTSKALEIILWLANERPRIDVYHVVKCAFYADKYHLNRYGRPLAGDNYIADTYGPLGKTVYGLLIGDPLEILALDLNDPHLPFRRDRGLWVEADRPPNMKRLSESDVEALRYALTLCGDKTFGELFMESHAEPAYILADGGPIRYEDLLDLDDPRREEKAAYLEETAYAAVL
jgi:hypothetical protein